MLRLVPILIAFALGATFAWWFPRTVVVERARIVSLDVASATARPGAGVADRNAIGVGVPPTTATLPSSHPSAGQRRALARALDTLANTGATVEPENLDDEATARLAESIRKHLLSQGAPP